MVFNFYLKKTGNQKNGRRFGWMIFVVCEGFVDGVFRFFSEVYNVFVEL